MALNTDTRWKIRRCHIAMRVRCFTVRFCRDGAAVESGVKCTGEMGKNRFFCIYAKTVFSSGCQGINYYKYVHASQSSLNKKVQLKET